MELDWSQLKEKLLSDRHGKWVSL